MEKKTVLNKATFYHETTLIFGKQHGLLYNLEPLNSKPIITDSSVLYYR